MNGIILLILLVLTITFPSMSGLPRPFLREVYECLKQRQQLLYGVYLVKLFVEIYEVFIFL